MSEHFKLVLRSESGVFNYSQTEGFLILPPKKIPTDFRVRGKNFFCAGFFLGFDLRITPDQIAEYCQKRQWRVLAGAMADFLLVFADFESGELFILTGQTGTFPCYFSARRSGFFCSTDFGWVKENTFPLSVNPDFVLDYLSLFRLPKETTVFKEILQVPPATLFKIDKYGDFSLEPLVDINKFLGSKAFPFASKKEFTDNFLEILSKIVEERLSAIGDFPFASDISSGLDVNLVCFLLKKLSKEDFVCYSRMTKFAAKDTRYKVMLDFVRKHGLKVKILRAEEYFPFSTEHELNWLLKYFYPFDHGLEMDYQLNLGVANDGNRVKFNGDGGDEIYHAPNWEKTAPFPLQNEYLWTKKACQGGAQRLLTEKGIRLLLDKDRFAAKKVFPSVLPVSPVMIGLLYFPIVWELEVWPISPFNDVRMVQLGRRIPRQGSTVLSKRDVWRDRTDIFIDGQFGEKGHFGEHIGLYLKKKSDFVLSVLENSILAQARIVKAGEIVKDIKEGKIVKYYNEPFSALDNLIRLEFFLQNQKGVKTPNL